VQLVEVAQPSVRSAPWRGSAAGAPSAAAWLRVAGSTCALAGAAVAVAAFDPASPGSHFPACIFHQTTGLWCPGCGLTRGVHHLLRGDVISALGSNVFTPVAVLVIVGAWWTWARRTLGAGPARSAARLVAWVPGRARASVGPAAAVLLAVYGVLRNVPIGPFRSLAP
jgi:hypothetical protein